MQVSNVDIPTSTTSEKGRFGGVSRPWHPNLCLITLSDLVIGFKQVPLYNPSQSAFCSQFLVMPRKDPSSSQCLLASSPDLVLRAQSLYECALPSRAGLQIKAQLRAQALSHWLWLFLSPLREWKFL